MNELRAFADGRWVEFEGLVDCRLASADRELGPPLEDELYGGMFGGEPAQFRRYPATAATSGSLTAWVLGDVLVGLELREATPPESALPALGPADATITSELGAAWAQELWPGRGLVLHRRDDRIAVVFGLAPFDLDGWESDPLRWWRVERRRR